MMRRIVACGIVLLLMNSAANGQPATKLDIGIDQKLQAPLPLDLMFRAEHGETVQLGQYFGARPVVLVLAYYRCPRLCNVSLNNLAASLSEIDYQAGRDYDVVIVSIDPRETPELAAAKKAAI